MRILAFPSRSHTPVRDWSTQEVADFYRAHRLLAENGVGIGIDRGVSDEGEPWMVFFDAASQDVFLHVARIDGQCHLICEPFNMRLKAADITSLVAQFEHAVTDYLAIRSERAKNVVIHPAARIIMSISAVFLLFKLETGEVHAKGLVDKAVGPDAKTTDKASPILARAQAAFQRAFDALEAPANAALIAGLILAGELALTPHRAEGNADDVPELPTIALIDHAPAAKGPSAGHFDLEEVHAVPSATNSSVQLAALAAPVLIASVESPKMVTLMPPELEIRIPAGEGVPVFNAIQFSPVASPQVAEAQVASDDAEAKSDAARALDHLFSLVGTVPNSAPAPTVTEPEPERVIDISLDRLDDMNTEFGFVSEVSLSDSKLYRLIEYFYSQMASYESEYQSGQVLVEEVGVNLLDESEIGIFTNVMKDGSTYTIVGRVDLIDDVLTFFS